MNHTSAITINDLGSFLSKLAENSDNVYWLMSPDFRKLEYISPAFEKIWGRPSNELYQNPQKWINYLHPEDVRDRYLLDQLAKRIAKEGEGARFVEDYRIIKPNGEVRWIVDRGFPIFGTNGECCGVTGVAVDITELKEREIALIQTREKVKAERAKSIFISNMSHDIRTPLLGVIGNCDLLEKQGDSLRDRELAHTIHVSAERLMQLLDDILELVSADEIAESSLNLRPFSLKERIAFINDLILPNILQQNIVLKIKVAQTVPEYILSDRAKIDRILLNLMSNALKFTTVGSIALEVTVVNQLAEEVWLEFKVIDTGIGIAPDQIPKIFDRFYRVNPSYENKYKGHGVGLYIVQKYVSLLRGSVDVVSEQGKGSTFTIKIPVQAAKTEQLSNVQIKEELTEMDKPLKLMPQPEIKITACEEESNKSSEQKVLVVEDDLIGRRVVKTFLERAGFLVDAVENAEKGFWQVMHCHYDLILTDIGLPGMNGNELTATIRGWEKATQQIPKPIVGLSAHGANQQSAAKKAGMNILLKKPLNDAKLLSIRELFSETKPKLINKMNSIYGAIRLEYGLPEMEEDLFDLEKFPLFNQEKALETCENMMMVKELFLILINRTFPEELPTLELAHRKNDWKTIQDIAHKIKGSALYCGTIRLGYACQYLEQYPIKSENEKLGLLYQQLLVVINETKQFIFDWLKEIN
jgi:PAS domain S-box-containing protein